MSEYFIAVGIAFAPVMAMVVSRWRRRGGGEPPPQGIVLLLSRDKPLEAPAIATIFGRVTETQFNVVTPRGGRPPTPADLPVGNTALGGLPSFLVHAAGDLFIVNSVAKPYFVADSVIVSKGVDEASVAKVLREHRAWLSVEILHPEAVSTANYRIVAQVIGELMSAECLALFHPESRKLVPAHPSDTLAQLRSQHPIEAVFGVSL